MLVLRDLVNKRYFNIYFLIFYCIQQHYFNLRDNNKAKQ